MKIGWIWKEVCIKKWIGKLKDIWLAGWMDGWKDRQMEG